MKNNKALGIVLWLAGLMVPLLFLVLVPVEMTKTVWVVLIFTVLVYIGHLILWTVLQKGKVDFLNLPTLMISVSSLIIQTLWAIVMAFKAQGFPTKVAILINTLFVLIQIIVVVLALISKNHIECAGGRQKNHHTEL